MSARSSLSSLFLIALSIAHPSIASAQDQWFARDKAEHFAATTGISAGGYAGAALLTEGERWKPLTGIGAGIGAAAGKELWDRSHGGTPSWKDFAWGAVGTAAGVTVAWLVDRMRRPDDRASSNRSRAISGASPNRGPTIGRSF